MKKAKNLNFISRMWNSAPVIIKAVLTGSIISGIGVGVWGAMFSYSKSMLAIIPMIVCLWVFWKFFNGDWGKGFSAAFRKESFRNTNLTSAMWKHGLILAVFRLIEFPAAKFTADYKIVDTFPLWAGWLILIMGSIVAGICEEVGFRGYMQAPMEKKYGVTIAIIVTSAIFTIIHLSHTWALPILPHIFCASVLLGIIAYRTKSLIPGIIGHSILDIFDYSIWWTDITGGFTKQPIFKTGVDMHFVIWVLIFGFALLGFFKVIAKLGNGERTLETNPLKNEVTYATKFS